MKQEELLTGKKILVVDDEPDISDTVEDLLPMCEVVKASTFEEAKRLLETQDFDIAILDIMGVDGYELLKIAKKKNIIAVMLTAHSLTVQDTKKSFELGAASFIPKDKIMDIAVFLTDILEGQKKGKRFWWRWLDRFADYYDRRFGPNWQEKDKDFWEKLKYFDRL
ncbi:MAG: response regulator [Deltaproteobacteria bacterium]|nr:MAG: response regulator [Deltaproteobacteria bacterium]